VTLLTVCVAYGKYYPNTTLAPKVRNYNTYPLTELIIDFSLLENEKQLIPPTGYFNLFLYFQATIIY
ncbi:MAG: hypothetical protein MJ211_13985, partial [Bacteroidales bacterium]|nr:hypothetical protein [Bacteroidales bacterium]